MEQRKEGRHGLQRQLPLVPPLHKACTMHKLPANPFCMSCRGSIAEVTLQEQAAMVTES